MIYLTKKDKEKTRFVLNNRLIEKIEITNDTVILLNNGKKMIVEETADEIIQKIIDFEMMILPKLEER